LTLSQIAIYPVKGLQAVHLEASVVFAEGLAHDRRWMLVDHEGRFLSQRQIPAMATLGAEVHEGSLVLSHGADRLTVEEAAQDRAAVSVWGDSVDALAPCPSADTWLSQRLHFPIRLVRMDSISRRPLKKFPDRPVSFADGYPLLLASEASLEDLNRRMESPLPMDRFRPNVVAAGARAWEEDKWEEVRIGEVIFAAPTLCSRCKVTTVNQESGAEEGPEPLRTLAKFRRGQDGKVYFGANLYPLTLGHIRLGDPIEPVKVRSAPSFEQGQVN
jgi:uncharacterized protein YcbX